MGDIADLIIEGEICQMCCCEMDNANGYPQTCSDCKTDDMKYEMPMSLGKKTPCPHCKKIVKKTGLDQHIQVVHKHKGGDA
jgi:hypothetical protein